MPQARCCSRRFRPWGECLEGRLLLNAGTLDPAFGSGGMVSTPSQLSTVIAVREAVQNDGKIVVVGEGPSQAVLARFNPNGSLDAAFGSGGIAAIGFGSAVALQADGKIVVVGDASNTANSFAIARYNPDGTADASFGSGGTVTVTALPGGEADAVAIQPDGKIVVAGRTGTIDVVRLNGDGSLDAAFGSGGVATATPTQTGIPFVDGMALDPAGRIVVAGGVGVPNGGSSFLLMRFTTTGSLDPTFGTGGQTFTSVGIDNRFDSVAVQSDGKIVATGAAFGGGTNAARFWVVGRFNANGSSDTSFGTGGFVTQTFGPGTGQGGEASSVALQPDGKIVAAGDSNNMFALARFNSDGSLDPSFGNGGTTTTAIGSFSRATSMVLHGNSIITAGASGDSNLALAQYQNDVTVIPPTFPPHLQPNQKVFVTGADAGGGPDVKVFDAATNQPLGSFFAFNPNFTGGVRVAVGDVNGDTIPDIITAAGPGGGPSVIVYSGKDGSQLFNFYAYDKNFTGGTFVAVGDVNGDGFADIICGADAGGGPNVTVFSGKDGSNLVSFFPYAQAFTGGVRVAAGDTDGDGKAEIITGAGPGGGPNVTVFRVEPLLNMLGLPVEEQTYFAYDSRFSAGIYVAAGDVNGDGKADVIVGAGAGGGPNVAVFSGVDGQPLSSFFPYDPAFTGGVRVGAVADGNGQADVLAVPGPGGGPDVKRLNGVTGVQLDEFFAYNPNFTGGLYVAGTAS